MILPSLRPGANGDALKTEVDELIMHDTSCSNSGKMGLEISRGLDAGDSRSINTASYANARR